MLPLSVSSLEVGSLLRTEKSPVEMFQGLRKILFGLNAAEQDHLQ